MVKTYDSRSVMGSPLHTIYMENGGISVVLVSRENNLPHLVHWGEPLSNPDTAVNLYDALHPQRVSGNLDKTPFPSIMPVQAEAWSGRSRFVVRRTGVELFCKFEMVSFTTDLEGETVDGLSDQARRLTGMTDERIRLAQDNNPTYPHQGLVPRVVAVGQDKEQGVELVWELQVLDSGLVRQKATVRNLASDSVLSVQMVELGFPLPAVATEVMTTTGHHLRERSPQRQKLTKGRYEKNCVMGRPDFDATLLMSVGTAGFGFEEGDVWSAHVGWSGNSTLSVDSTPFSLPLLGGGEFLFGGEADLDEDGAYTTPWVYGSYGHGLNQVAQRFHHLQRELHPNLRTKPRPVILNTWEAVYFNHSFEALKALADHAQECGVERFVVDDGWFGSRRSETSGLGDWQVSREVWPQGLGPLADYVHSLGMEFGLWFEPEMVNPNSEVARAHPDWMLGPTHSRLALEGRFQQAIDLTNDEVLSYIFKAMDSLVGEVGIDYIKWDHNKMVTEAVSRKSGLPAVHRQTEAVYAIFDALKLRHPGLEIESCSSGGGRVDMGILSRCDRIWASDCVDPVERASIQPYTSLLVAPEMIGEHIGASPAHTTLRSASLQMRAAMSFFGHMGVEWDLNKVDKHQRAELTAWIDEYKKARAKLERGLLVHSDVNDEAVRLDGAMTEDQSFGYFRFTQVTTSPNYPVQPVRLPGLDPQASYRIRPLKPCEGLTGIGNGQSPLYWWTSVGVVLDAWSLMNFGVRPPQLYPAQAVIFTVERV